MRKQQFLCTTVFMLVLAAVATTPTQAQTYTVLHLFTNMPDGGNPAGPLIQDAQGTLYGTTKGGGGCDGGLPCGTVFKVDSDGTETVLYSFQGGSDGVYPLAGVIRDAAGNLYGTTQGNGFLGALSTVFKLTPAKNGQWKETVLYDFNGPEGGSQDEPLVLDQDGNLYGTSPGGGKPNCGWGRFNAGCGSMYKLTPDRKITVIHVFTGLDGMQPEGGLVRDAKGNLYGSTIFGGIRSCKSPGGGGYPEPGCGTVYKLDVSGKLTVLHKFTGHEDGSNPVGVIVDGAGNLYGIADAGGVICNANYIYGCGTIFKIDNAGKFSVLYKFDPQSPGLGFVYSNLVRDSKGNLYGTNEYGGTNNAGFLFELDTKEKFSVLYDFAGLGETQDGNNPQGVIMDSAGNFYGNMFIGGLQNENFCGAAGCGTVFKLTH